MPRDVTVTFADGTSHTYQGAPDSVTPDEVQTRAEKQFAKTVKGIDGGASVSPSTNAAMRIPGNEVSSAQAEAAPSWRDRLTGMIETPMALGAQLAGGVAAPVAGVLGTLTSGKYGTPEGIAAGNAAAQRTQQAFYQPRTQTAQNAVEATGKFLNDSGLIATVPMAGEIGALSRSAPTALRAAGDAANIARTEGGYAGEALRTGAAAVLNPIGESARSGARSLMQSAIKPTIAQLRSGDAEVAIQTLLDRGISPTASGVKKLQTLIDQKNSQIQNAIGDSGAVVNTQNVLDVLNRDVAPKFRNQVNPTADLNAISNAAQDFAGSVGESIPVQQAQALKQGTYQVLSKKYGQLGSADIEAQKGLARGLKEEIGKAVPEVVGLNAEESALIKTLDVSERRALMEVNKNPMGLASLAGSPHGWLVFMADRSAAFKGLIARALNRIGEGVQVEKPTFGKVGPQADSVMPGKSNIVPYDYSQAVVKPEEMQNWTYGRPDPIVTTGAQPSGAPRLGASSAESTLAGVAGRRGFDRSMAATLDQQAQMAADAKAKTGRQTTGRGTLFDLDPLTGKLREASQGIKGATPDTFQNFGNDLNSAAEKVSSGQRFAMSASEKVAWDKTRVDLATVSPEFKALSDSAIAGKMMDREWVASAITKAREKASAFEKLAQRANDAQASRAALASRERLMDLLETLQDKQGPRSSRLMQKLSSGGQSF